jgi:hypothetical protein
LGHQLTQTESVGIKSRESKDEGVTVMSETEQGDLPARAMFKVRGDLRDIGEEFVEGLELLRDRQALPVMMVKDEVGVVMDDLEREGHGRRRMKAGAEYLVPLDNPLDSSLEQRLVQRPFDQNGAV